MSEVRNETTGTVSYYRSVLTALNVHSRRL